MRNIPKLFKLCCAGSEGAVLIKCQSLTLSKPAKISFYRIEQLDRTDTHTWCALWIWIASKIRDHIFFSPGVPYKHVLFNLRLCRALRANTAPERAQVTGRAPVFLESFVIYSTFEPHCGWVGVWAKMAPVEPDTLFSPLRISDSAGRLGPAANTDDWDR